MYTIENNSPDAAAADEIRQKAKKIFLTSSHLVELSYGSWQDFVTHIADSIFSNCISDIRWSVLNVSAKIAEKRMSIVSS